MKFRQAKKIVHGNSNVHKKYRKRRPPIYKVVDDPDAEDGFVHCEEWVYPSLHDIDIIRRAELQGIVPRRSVLRIHVSE